MNGDLWTWRNQRDFARFHSAAGLPPVKPAARTPHHRGETS
jgi:hypothetical protein